MAIIALAFGVSFLGPSCAAGASSVWDAYPAFYKLDEWSLDWSPIHGLQVEAHRIVQVNRSSGAGVGDIRIWDTFFQRLKSFEGVVRDTLGNVLYSVDLDDVRSVAPFTEFRLYSGDAIRAVELAAPQPPYVFEARWRVEIDNPFFWPDWVFGDRYPRQRAVYRVAIPPRNDIRYRQVALSLIQSEEREPRRRVFTWKLNDWEPGSLNAKENHAVVPLLYVAPVEFRVGRRKGRTDSWDALGQWYWDLTEGRLGLDDDQLERVDRQIADMVSPRAQAAALKDWVSDRWRYVAIEVGLGGWQPHPAKEVFDNRYGDCKDVVFLWISMLRERGVDAFPALIRSRNPLPIDPTFPKDWFDHVVAMAVINGDTLWADPSDRHYRLGTLPHSCEARWALVVGEFGGQLVRTPCRPAAENRRTMHCRGQLDMDGNLEFRARIASAGHYAQLLPLDSRRPPPIVAAAILGVAAPALTAELGPVEVVSADEVTAVIRGQITGWALTGQKRLVVRPQLGGWRTVDTLAGGIGPGRTHFPQLVFDTLVIHFPSGWSPELWPEAEFRSETSGEFGEARTFEDDSLVVVRHVRWEPCERTDIARQSTAQLRSAYREAGNVEWIFREDDDDELGGSFDTVEVPSESTIPPDAIPNDSTSVRDGGGR
jgi:hypothetical protein